MCFYLRNWQVTFLLYTLGVFISEYTAKAFTEPRDYRVVFLIQKDETHLMGGDRKETDEKEKIFEMVDRGGISGFHCRSGNICIYAV